MTPDGPEEREADRLERERASDDSDGDYETCAYDAEMNHE